MKKSTVELGVGLFLIAGFLCFGYLSTRLAKSEFFGGSGYEVHADFSNCGGLKAGASVVIAGVEVGRVKRISLEDYQAHIVLLIHEQVHLDQDVMASVKTKGLIGEKYVELVPGGMEETIKPGGRIINTEPAMDLEQLISKFVQGKV
ncbi:MAG: outer membrane lipid asymmetry maintenance protein MlaD [Verrucomicrobia bacterium]|nr:outer membrane lipid asymmetry maintenance protein MlaD [Verrucomicrobiota bacterium]